MIWLISLIFLLCIEAVHKFKIQMKRRQIGALNRKEIKRFVTESNCWTASIKYIFSWQQFKNYILQSVRNPEKFLII